jgi:uncharacterized protein YecE (DUF72 family)
MSKMTATPTDATLDVDTFRFRGLHPDIFLGTASDRYAGWLGQIYTPERYAGRITRRTNTVEGKAFVEEVLPVESVAEYFEHFRVVELDFTFYRPILDGAGKPTPTRHVLQQYRRFLGEGDRVILKVPQLVFAQKLRRSAGFVANPDYLRPEVFVGQFYEPAVDLFGPSLAGMVFEQEYQRKEDRREPEQFARELELFFAAIPPDPRYHVELRTDSYLVELVFEVFEKHGVGQVLSHWTWLPPLKVQFARAGHRFFNSGRQCVVRLMTPRNVRYEDAYARAHPFNRQVDGMMDPKMVEETVQIMHTAIREQVQVELIANNRSGGNAPLIVQQIARHFLDSSRNSAAHSSQASPPH